MIWIVLLETNWYSWRFVYAFVSINKWINCRIYFKHKNLTNFDLIVTWLCADWKAFEIMTLNVNETWFRHSRDNLHESLVFAWLSRHRFFSSAMRMKEKWKWRKPIIKQLSGTRVHILVLTLVFEFMPGKKCYISNLMYILKS